MDAMRARMAKARRTLSATIGLHCTRAQIDFQNVTPDSRPAEISFPKTAFHS
jgi:hypothetical protein